MKNALLLAVVTLASSAAFAWPTLSDTVVYDGTVSRGSQSLPAHLQLQITSLDAATDSAVLTQSATVSGRQLPNQTQTVKVSELQMMAGAMPDLVANCAKRMGGTPEVVTIPAGTFNTCKVASNDKNSTGFTWYADVIFGMVRQTSTTSADATTTDLILTSATAGH